MRCAERACAALAVALLAAGCGPRGGAGSTASPAPGGTPSAAPSATAVPVHVHGFGTERKPSVLSETKGGRRIYVIRAIQFEGDIGGGSADGAAVLQQPHITFIDRSGARTVADAPKATVKQRDKSVFMTGGVHARTAEGAVMTCDTLRYDGDSERFRGEGHVRLTGPSGLELDGEHLEGDVRLHDVRVTSGGAT